MTLALDAPIKNQKSEIKNLCAHCSLPVPQGLIVENADHQFCCRACQTVFTLIHSCNLDRYYQYRNADAAINEPAKTTGKAYREFDDPTFLNLHAPPQSNSPFTIPNSPFVRITDFYLEGVHCAACVWLVEKLPQILPYVLSARLDLPKSLVQITWSDSVPSSVPSVHSVSSVSNTAASTCTLSKIARTLDSLGYPPHPARSANSRQIRTLDARRQIIRIGVAGACAGNTMLLATALYAGLFARMDPAYTLLFRYLSMLIGLLAILWPSQVFFRGALAALRTRTPHLDLPIALGLSAGTLAGVFNTLTNHGEIYFDSLTVLVFLLLVGRFLQYRKQTASDDALELLFSLTPNSARKLVPRPSGSANLAPTVNGTSIDEQDSPNDPSGSWLLASGFSTQDVSVSSLTPNDLIEVLPGECIPADGLLSYGNSTIDDSLLTGESLPKSVSLDSPVFAGTTNLSSPIHIRVAASGEATRVGKLMRLVTECSRQKAPIVLFADRIAARFLIAVLAISVLTFLLCTLRGSNNALDHAVAILIVSCPCALGLATPLAVSVAIGRAARRGILIKGGPTLERLAVKRGLLLLDKTGTITTGRPTLIRYLGDENLKPLIAQLESHSTHPIARALAQSLGKEFTQSPITNYQLPITQLPLSNITQHRQSITAQFPAHLALPNRTTSVSESPHAPQCVSTHASATHFFSTITIGSPSAIQAPPPEWLAPHIEAALHSGQSPILIAIDNHVRAACIIGDQIRPDVPATLQTLRQQGWEIAILSGDHPAVVQHVATQLHIQTAHGGLLPEDKLRIVQEHMQDKSKTVLMVGDGVNDAAALAAASVGIAVHGGAEASLAAANVYLRTPGLSPILELTTAAHQTLAVIRRSLYASLTYNLFAVSLAVAGLITPLIAAILMPLSSLTVLSLALTTRTFNKLPTYQLAKLPNPPGAR